MTRRPATGADGAHGTQRDPCQHRRRCTHPQAARDEHPGPPGLIRAGARLRRLRAAGDPAPGTHPYGNAPESTAKKPPTGTSGAEEPGTSPTPPAPSGRTPVLATPGHRDSPTGRQYGAGQRPPGKRVPWPAMRAASPVGCVAVAALGAPGPRCGRRAPPRRAVSQTWAESPPWARQAPPRRDVSQTTDLLDPSGRSQSMRMIMCREHPDENARRDSRTSASAVFAPVARIPCSTMRRHVLMHEDDGKSQCHPPSMGSSRDDQPHPPLSPLDIVVTRQLTSFIVEDDRFDVRPCWHSHPTTTHSPRPPRAFTPPTLLGLARSPTKHHVRIPLRKPISESLHADGYRYHR